MIDIFLDNWPKFLGFGMICFGFGFFIGGIAWDKEVDK